MALSDDDLWRVIDAVPGGEELGDGGAWLLSVLRAVEAEVRAQDESLIRQLVEALERSTKYDDADNEVLATARKRLAEKENGDASDTDHKRMLEMAAKAYGITLRYNYLGGRDANQPWDSLEDDGDALRLAAAINQLDLVLLVGKMVADGADAGTTGIAAIRRAITYAAAQFGKAMPRPKTKSFRWQTRLGLTHIASLRQRPWQCGSASPPWWALKSGRRALRFASRQSALSGTMHRKMSSEQGATSVLT